MDWNDLSTWKCELQAATSARGNVNSKRLPPLEVQLPQHVEM